jgi:hypothetical protein
MKHLATLKSVKQPLHIRISHEEHLLDLTIGFLKVGQFDLSGEQQYGG